jgi:hypothetical protein
MVQDDTSLAERVAYILGPSSAAAQALAHVACIKTQGGRGCIFYAKDYLIVRTQCLDQHEEQRDVCTADSIGQMAEDQSGEDESCGVGGIGARTRFLAPGAGPGKKPAPALIPDARCALQGQCQMPPPHPEAET